MIGSHVVSYKRGFREILCALNPALHNGNTLYTIVSINITRRILALIKSTHLSFFKESSFVFFFLWCNWSLIPVWLHNSKLIFTLLETERHHSTKTLIHCKRTSHTILGLEPALHTYVELSLWTLFPQFYLHSFVVVYMDSGIYIVITCISVGVHI